MCELWGRRAWTDRWDDDAVAPPTRFDHERVSDADREATIADLRRHTGDGRLTLDEFEERVGEVFAAKTVADLDHTVRELPTSRNARRNRARPRASAGRVLAGLLAAPFVFVALVTVAISLAVGAFVVWPLFVFGFMWWGGGCGAKARGEHRPAHDERARPREQDELIHA